MPSPDVVQAERAKEDAAQRKEDKARSDQEDGFGNPQAEYKDAADHWRKIGDDYKAKSEDVHTSSDDELDYICRAAWAYAHAAEDFDKASKLAKQANDQLEADDLHAKSQAAYREAAKLYERCGGRWIELGDPAKARPALEWAESCYMYLGADDDCKRVRRAARFARKLLEKILAEDGSPVRDDDDDDED